MTKKVSLSLRTFLFLFSSLLLLSSCATDPAKGTRPSSLPASPSPSQSYTDAATGMEFIFVKGGCFGMGDTFGDGGPAEKPVHTVCVGNFAIGKYEVTVGQFTAFTNATGYTTEAEKGDGCYGFTGSDSKKDKSRNWRTPGFAQSEKHPVVCVSWNDAKAFADWLATISGTAYRLPTEAEWEYAARSGGKSYKYAWGKGRPSANIADESLYKKFPSRTTLEAYDDSFVHTAPVGSFKPSDLGIFDMTGNVWELVGDWYDEDYYKTSPKENPKGPDSGEYRVLRGGSWLSKPADVRAANRFRINASNSIDNVGFRLVGPPQ
jgi:formylglycine-generating enzyme